MISLRTTAQSIGLSGRFSVISDFLGYVTAPKDQSLHQQIWRLRRHIIDLNLIRVGFDSLPEEDRIAKEQKIDAAVQFARDLFAVVDLGIGRVQRYAITTAEADGLQHLGSGCDAALLTHEWSVPNEAIDVFFVLSYEGDCGGDCLGVSAISGSCDKEVCAAGDCDCLTGSVIDITSHQLMKQVLPHELGHYLGLDHTSDFGNLMHPVAAEAFMALTCAQGSKMRSHCFVRHVDSPHGPALALDPAEIHFGSVRHHDRSTMPLTITNTLGYDVEITIPASSRGMVTWPSLNRIVPSGQVASINITFLADSNVGAAERKMLVVTSDDPVGLSAVCITGHVTAGEDR
jgi:hypothetical protein